MVETKRFEVLVVDDEPDILHTIARYLAKSIPGTEMFEAENGEQALRILDEQDIDLVLTDYRMPGMNGLDLLVEARKRRPDTLRLIFTAYPDMEIAIRAANEGRVERFFTKPVDPAEIRDTVRLLLREHRRSTLRARAYERALEAWVAPKDP